ncbi:MAG: GGDEF domain-containing protein [Proteobacteria bacterium]|nr:MAG: GGDEF domain-containing protein [Pseudomonadota bacterium]
MVLVFGLLFTVVQSTVLLLVDHASFGIARERNAEELRVGERVFLRLLDQNRQRLLQAAEVLSRDFAFRQAVATGDSPTIASVLENHGTRIQAGVMMLVGLDNTLVADSLHPAVRGGVFAYPGLIRAAQRRGRASAIMPIEGRLCQVVVVPVLAPDPVGWVAMGFPLDQAFLDDLHTLTSLDLSFLGTDATGSWKLFATTQITGEAQRAVAELARLNASTVEPVRLGEFDSIVSMLTQDGVDPIRIVLQRSITEGLEPLARLKSLLLLMTLASIVASIVGAVIVARRITQPLLELSRFASKVRDGDYTGRVQLKRSDELGALSASFTHMLEGIASREAEIMRLAYEDGLTGLPNRARFNERLRTAVNTYREIQKPLSVLVMDLDRFKYVNDTLGHGAGDIVLREVAKRLQAVSRESDTVARLGGDEFAMLLSGADGDRAPVVARMIQAVLLEPIDLDGQSVDVGCSIGIAHCPAHGEDPGLLMRHADIAMYAAKHQKSGFALYDVRYDRHRADHLSLLGDLRKAIGENELRLHYQPKIDLRRGQVVGVEALVRWEHPERGLVPPSEFVPFAEQTGMIRFLTRWVIEEALSQCGAWYATGLALNVSVNVSTRDLLDRDLAPLIDQATRRHGVPAELLTIEVTESALIEDPQRTQETIRGLKQRGVRMSLDDYGTGYSSLANIQRLQFDELKVDRSFVTHMSRREKDSAIVRSTIELGHNLGLTVVAEGVEDPEVIAMLRELGCDFIQGYAVSRPLACNAVAKWIASCQWNAGRGARVAISDLRVA